MTTEMIFNQNARRRKVLARVGLMALAAVAAGALSGCATDGAGAADPAGGASTPMSSASLAERDFYADWYDPSAVVLPPPPAEKTRR